MKAIQRNLLKKIEQYKTLTAKLAQLNEQIDKESRNLLKELQKVDGWECMIKECEEHYAKYPKEFFDWCSVTHDDDAVQFVKYYSDGTEYEVLEIGLYDSPADQVHHRQNEIRNKNIKEQEEIKKKELAELERLKRKYRDNI